MEHKSLTCFVTNASQAALPVILIPRQQFPAWLSKQKKVVKNWLTTSNFRAETGSICFIPAESGKLSSVLCCIADEKDFWSVGALPFTLPTGVYFFDTRLTKLENFAIAWGLGAYQFIRYKKATQSPAQLMLPKGIDQHVVMNIVHSIYLVRDLINVPTEDMGPSELAKITVDLGKHYKATVKQIVGQDLLKTHYASIYTVGRASNDPPRLLDLQWGNKNHPKVTLVGKGVCFDSGGLDIKPSSAMLLMKKDMAGAAHVLGLARMIMQAKLPIRLRVLIPAVENAISGNAYRPGDIIKSRKGITIEVGNTDAEGRVILADALTEAVSEKPDLLIDIATLTGAARVAVGTEISALFSNHDEFAEEIVQHAKREVDPIWRLPLYMPYREMLNSPIADINNVGADVYAGAITAALFLKEFVPDDVPWLHFDMMAWNLRTRPGRPHGGEAMALRALFSYLTHKYAS